MPTTLDTLLTQTPGTCGGRLRIDGTRITVHRIAAMYRRGDSPEEMVGTYPHLSLAQIYAALAYYHANRDHIDAELAADDALYDELREARGESDAQ